MQLVKSITSYKDMVENIRMSSDDVCLSNIFVEDSTLEKLIENKKIVLLDYFENGGVCFARDRGTYYQIYFFVRNEIWLHRVLVSAARLSNKSLTLEFLGANEAARNAVLKAGFVSYMTFSRMTMILTGNIKNEINDAWFVKPAEVDQVLEILNETMDAKCEYIPDEDEIIRAVEDKEILGIRSDKTNELAAILMFHRNGALLNWLFWAERIKYRKEKLALRLYEPYLKLNGDARRSMLWVRDNNPMIELYYYWGFKKDGLTSEAFIYEK